MTGRPGPVIFKYGLTEGIRTPDIRDHNATL